MIGGILLAAGRSVRFGSDKLLATLDDEPLIRFGARTLASAVDRLYVVIPPGAQARRTALDGIAARFVEHAQHASGMAGSIAAGVAAVSDATRAVIVALADQPRIDAAVVRQLKDEWRASGALAVAPRYRDGRGHPVLFDRACFARLHGLAGDTGARAILDSLGPSLVLVDVDADMPRDVDTPAMLAELRARPDS